MAWVVLIASGLLETAWATALASIKGLTRPLPLLIFAVAAPLSLIGLGYALRELPVGTAYAIWVGIGAVGTAAYGMIVFGEPVTVARILCLLLIISGVIGLKLVH